MRALCRLARWEGASAARAMLAPASSAVAHGALVPAAAGAGAAPIAAANPPGAVALRLATAAAGGGAAAADAPCRAQVAESVRADMRKRLQECGDSGDARGLMSVVGECGPCFEVRELLEALAQLARAADSSRMELAARRELFGSDQYAHLVGMVERMAGALSADELCAAAQSLGRLADGGGAGGVEGALDELARAAIDQLPRMRGAQLAPLVEGLAQARHSPGALFLDAVADRLHALRGAGAGAGGAGGAAGLAPDDWERISASLMALGLDVHRYAPNPPPHGAPRERSADYK